MLGRFFKSRSGNPSQSMPAAIAHHEAGRLAEAEAIYRRVLEAEPEHVDALHFLGFLSFQQGSHERAAGLIGRSLELHPGNLHAHYNLGRVFQAQGKLAEAARCFRASAQIAPDNYEAHFKLAGIQLGLGEVDDAIVSYQRVIALKPDYAAAHCDLGNALRSHGRLDDALASYLQALQLDPVSREARFNLGIAYRDLGRRDEALACFEKLTGQHPDFAEAQYSLGHMFRDADLLADAAVRFRRALALRPDYAEARWSLAMAQIPQVYAGGEDPMQFRAAFAAELGELERWLGEHRLPDPSAVVGVMQPFSLAYTEQPNRPLLERYGRLCSRLMADWHAAQGFPARPARSGGGPLRVGVVSGHFRNHSVWHAVVKGWFQHLDRERFALDAYYLGSSEDAETAFARSRAAHFEHGLRSLRQWVETIQRGAPDVLIYPEIGMDPMALKLASLRLAPVQATAWGHPETSGLPTLDHFLSAEDMEPPGAQEHYSENLVALPHLGGCVQSRGVEPEAPAFGSFGIDAGVPLLVCPGVPFKYAPQHDWIFPEIAARLGRCRLVFFAYGAHGLSEKLQSRLRGAFAARKLDFDRCVTFLPWQTNAAFHGWLARADVFLDTIGFSGFNTAVQAIQRALPIVTREGRFLRGRLASGPLKRIGLQELVAASEQDYVELAVRLVRDGDYCEHIEERMREGGGALFGDLAPIRGLEDFLARVAPR